MNADDVGSVSIGAREIYDLGLRTKEAVERLELRLGDVSQELADHEVRIRDIEKTRWPLSPANVLTAVLAVIALGVELLPKLAK